MTYGSTDAEKKTHLVKTSKSPLDIHQEYTYDSKGNVLTQQTRNSTASTFIKGATAYTTDQNYATTQTDARGKTVSTVTDANGQTVSYAYDALRRVTGVQTTADGRTYKNAYVYADDKLVSVSHNTGSDTDCDVTYHFEYDAQNRPTVVKVGNQALSTNAYNATPGDPLYGTLTETTFGNGDGDERRLWRMKRIAVPMSHRAMRATAKQRDNGEQPSAHYLQLRICLSHGQWFGRFEKCD